jgi:glycosyltransferase involved in cell wall biosynthesis
LKKLKVIQLIPELNSGGVERGTLEVGKYLSEQGHESVVVSNGGILVDQLLREGSRHIKIPVHRKNPCSLLQVFKLKKLFIKEQPDIVHARSRVPAWVCYLALSGIPKHLRPRFITTVHGFYSVNPYSEIMTKGDAVICVSESIKEYVTRNYPEVQEEKLSLIHRGISQEEFPGGFAASVSWLNNWYSQFPETENKKLILLAGRITQLKGHEDFLKLLVGLPGKFHGLIVGSVHPKRKKYYKLLLDKTKEMKLEQRVTFAGLQSDMKEIYSLSHVALSLSSKPESFGRTILEALSCGCPVVGYGHGGVGEILRNCFPYGLINLNDLDMAVSKIKNVHDLRSEITIPNFYSLNFMLKETVQAYFGTLNKNNPSLVRDSKY